MRCGFEDINSHLCVVTIVGPGIVFIGIDAIVPDASHRTPIEITEIDDEIWWNVATLSIDVFGFENLRVDVISVFVYDCFELCLQFITDIFIVFLANSSVWLSAFNVYKNPSVISAFSPRLCFFPIYHIRCPACNFLQVWL